MNQILERILKEFPNCDIRRDDNLVRVKDNGVIIKTLDYQLLIYLQDNEEEFIKYIKE
jgi:hypothetical protein